MEGNLLKNERKKILEDTRAGVNTQGKLAGKAQRSECPSTTIIPENKTRKRNAAHERKRRRIRDSSSIFNQGFLDQIKAQEATLNDLKRTTRKQDRVNFRIANHNEKLTQIQNQLEDVVAEELGPARENIVHILSNTTTVKGITPPEHIDPLAKEALRKGISTVNAIAYIRGLRLLLQDNDELKKELAHYLLPHRAS
eukprot:CFRG5060T1